ncbi:MAG TPA: MFS transporter [Streptosporangiaceae bacterium]
MTLRHRARPSASRMRAGGVSLAALAATTMLIQGDQSALAQAVHGIEQQFGLSDQIVGLIPLIMAACAAIGSIPFGVLADHRRRTWVLAGVCFAWAVGMGLGAAASTAAVLFAARLLTGAAEGTPPVAISLLSDYFPVRRRSEAMGGYQAGAIIGAFVGLLGGGVAVQIGGWRWAFWIWVPVGLAVAVWYLFVHEPGRGHQDARFEAQLGQAAVAAKAAKDGEPATPEVACLATGGYLALPEPRQGPPPPEGGTSLLEALRHLMRIPSMWFGTLSLTVSQLLLYGLSFWGVTYFERVHHLGPAFAGLLSTVLGAGSAIGILSGGFLADRLLRHGHVNARVYVVAYGSIGATLVLAPAFASTNLWIGAPLIFLGGILLTLPIAPAEALCTDVVPPQLRGRGAMVRQVVRTASFAGPYLIGVVSVAITSHSASASTAVGLHWAIVAVCPLYGLGGLIMLAAVRHYPRDISYVVAHARARSAANGKAKQAPEPNGQPESPPVPLAEDPADQSATAPRLPGSGI